MLNGGAASGGSQDRTVLLVMQALEAVTRLSKGLPSALITRTRPKLGEPDFASSLWHPACL